MDFGGIRKNFGNSPPAILEQKPDQLRRSLKRRFCAGQASGVAACERNISAASELNPAELAWREKGLELQFSSNPLRESIRSGAPAITDSTT
jgi:hypothetical protein